MYEDRWSPFDPKWYQQAFDKSISTADQLFNQDAIIAQGYHIPDADGSKSSVFRNEAVLNNSFNEKHLRESLKDIYLNSSHKLKASNHDNTHFFQWHGKMSDMTLSENTNLCEIRLPAETFIYPNERDRYKLSQFYRKWIKVEDVLNNWDIFKWCCLVFINQKIYSDYELRIDDHEVTLRFKYYDHWVTKDYPVYVYKFDTNAQDRIKVARVQIVDQLQWKLPIKYLAHDDRIANSKNVMVAFNRIGDPSLRTDGRDNVDVLGDNLEFLTIEDGIIDLSDISNTNKLYLQSEFSEWMWMSIIVPKFFHEYPILLPVDTIYRPYEANFQEVYVDNLARPFGVHTKPESEYKKVYVDLNGDLKSTHNGWKQMIRPIVLSDAYDGSNDDIIYESMSEELTNIRNLTVQCADMVENFRVFTWDGGIDAKYIQYIDEIDEQVEKIKSAYEGYLNKRYIEHDPTYISKYNTYKDFIRNIKDNGVEEYYFRGYTQDEENSYWFTVSPMIYIPRELVDRYNVFITMAGMGRQKNLWVEDKDYKNQIRFQRPIDDTDFWTFEYDPDEQVWRPYPLAIEHHFPDVYVPSDSNEEVPRAGRIFKTFIFYSDTMNVRNESSDVVRPTATWDEDMQEYHYEQEAVYRDIFMEKFYWMGIRAIYKGLLMTECRWEALEYIMDNPSYERFNNLFMKTMDPYFKLGLATYLKSSNYNFPFDDAISKMQESINTEWIGYKKVTNFEIYLNKDWVPSYFDYVTKIMDNWDYESRLLRRPRSTFDVDRLMPTFIDVQMAVYRVATNLSVDVTWLISKLKDIGYNINSENIELLETNAKKLYDIINRLYTYTNELDMDIFSIEDVNTMISLTDEYYEVLATIEKYYESIYDDVVKNNVWKDKLEIVQNIGTKLESIPGIILEISKISQSFNMDGFMKLVNDLKGYTTYPKNNPDDKSLLGKVNEFDDAWSEDVKKYRDVLFSATVVLSGNWDPMKSYNVREVTEFKECVDSVSLNLNKLEKAIKIFWDIHNEKHDTELLDQIDDSRVYLSNLITTMDEYLKHREELISITESIIYDCMLKLSSFNLNPDEISYRDKISVEIENMISALSYIAGENNRTDAMNALDKIKAYLLNWIEFLAVEEEVFNKLLALSEPPIDFLQTLKTYDALLKEICKFMNTVNQEFTPDTNVPTYSDIYEIDEIDIISGGFLHEVGDKVYIPQLGSYQITDINGDVSTATALDSLRYRTTTFRDPTWQKRVYDSITDGKGMGITIKAVSSNHTRMVDDTVVERYITRVQNCAIMIQQNTASYNPHDNVKYTSQLEAVDKIKADWDELISRYGDYMTADVIDKTTDLIYTLVSIKDHSNTFIENRKMIDLEYILTEFEKFIFTAYDYIESLDKQDETFFYYDDNIRSAYNTILDFYGNGTSWNDGPELVNLLGDVKSPMRTYLRDIVEPLGDNNITTNLKSIYNDIFNKIDELTSAVLAVPNLLIDIEYIIRQVNSKSETIPALFHTDIWYTISSVSIAKDGIGYKRGDIVAVVPELPTDVRGDPITEQEDIIMNDTIFLQVTQVDEDGRVINIQPLLEYALPYPIWGLRDVVTCVGNGHGLSVDIYTHCLELADSTLFGETNNEPLDQFDENDMFTFKFENIHDLDITYEVFVGGKQVTNFIKRHDVIDNDPLHPGLCDILYLNANDVISLQKSSVFIPAENYFVYKINNIEIIDPGAGYAEGQDIYIDTEAVLVKLKVASLMLNSLKGILDVSVTPTTQITFNDINPEHESAKVVRDSLNNIDDEYNVGYYDKLTKDGIKKSITKIDGLYIAGDYIYVKELSQSEVENIWNASGSGYLRPVDNEITHYRIKRIWLTDGDGYTEPTDSEINKSKVSDIWDKKGDMETYVEPKEELVLPDDAVEESQYTYVAKRFDNLDDGDRNSTFMYPDVDKPTYDTPDGDPDDHIYHGSRIDNSQIYIEELSMFNINYIWATHGSGYREPNDSEINRSKVDNIWDLNGVDYIDPDDNEIKRLMVRTIWDTNGDGYVEPKEELWSTTETSRRWNSMMNIIPPTHPFIPDDQRYPTGQDPKGEYQFIQRQRIHSSITEVNDDVTRISSGSILNSAMLKGDLIVQKYEDLPKHTMDWPDGKIGKVVIVENDSTNNGHRMSYKIRTFVAAGFFVYDIPEVADLEWGTFDVDWMNEDFYPDYPSTNTQYPDAPWRTAPSYQKIQRDIVDGKYERKVYPSKMNFTTYIHDATVDDISVFNYTTKEWEDLNDTSRWKFEIKTDDEGNQIGFTLKFITDVHYNQIYVKELSMSDVKYIWTTNGAGYEDPMKNEINNETVTNIWDLNGVDYIDPDDNEIKRLMVRTIWDTNGDGYVEPKEELWVAEDIDPTDVPPYSYDMRLYLNKLAVNQKRNAELKKDAIIKIASTISEEVNKPAVKRPVNTGRHLRIRKLFPYEQKESFVIGTSENGDPLGYEMNFKLAPYMHFKNEIHLEDIKIYNKSAGRFENILDRNLFEVRFKDPKASNRGYEIQTKIIRSIVDTPGSGFVSGEAWAYNEEFCTHVFGTVEAEPLSDGHILSFTPLHFINPPDESISLEFDVYQYDNQTKEQVAVVMMEFQKEKVEVWDDGYIHNVSNRMAPVPKEFKVIVQYNLDGPGEYDIIISKSSRTWTFVDPSWRMSPTFHIPDYNIQKDRLYVLTDTGRFPLTNPSTGKPTLRVVETGEGTDVTYLNLYRRYEHLEIHSTPYPMRSVYIQRRIPKSGYINLSGKINKPLNKKYFEFWVNGKLLHDEVTIITPTKIFLHGLKSLKNFELIEINRDSNEYFSDEFLEVEKKAYGRSYPRWNFRTYLDDVLEGTLKNDNYTLEEQEYLLSPVWKQVEATHPEYKNFPPNVDIEDDILLRVNAEDYPIDLLDNAVYQVLVIDQPTIEGHPIIDQNITFDQLGFVPMDDSMLTDIMNEEWSEEIENDPYFPKHVVISDDEWYGMTTRLYDEYGIQVHNLNDAVYKVTDPSLLRIKTDTKLTRIIRQEVSYDLD